MTRQLIAKELREHWLPFAALIGLSFVALALVTIGATMAGEAGNVLEALRSFLITFSIPFALVTSNRLVTREYQGKTQLFLESLPLARSRMIAVKYAMGFTITAGFTVVSMALLLPAAAHRQHLTSRFVEIVALRALAFTFVVYSFFFTTGMLGRYRMAIYAAILLGLVVLASNTDLEIGRFGPFALMDKTFPYEREVLPLEHLGLTLALGAGLTILAFALALTREGSAAAMLAEKMSHREKIFVTATLLGMLFLAEIFDKKPQKYPFNLSDAIVKSSSAATVKVEIGPEQDTAEADKFAGLVHQTLTSAAEYLDLPRTPPVFITTRRDLDANRYERGELVRGEGVLVRINLSSKEFDRDRFRMWLVREVLLTATQGRALLESKSWVLDGFGPFLVRLPSDGQTTPNITASDRQLALRAAYGTSGEQAHAGLEESDLRNWLSFRDRVGEGIAAGVAWSGLDVLLRRQGPERTRRFLRAVLASPAPDDLRALWFERTNSLESQFDRFAEMKMATFLAAWRSELDTARDSFRADLDRLPRLRGELWFEPLSAETRTVRYRVALDPEPEGVKAQTTLFYADLPAFQTAVPKEQWQREDIEGNKGKAGELIGTWPRGARLYWTFMTAVPALGCDVISGWNRQEVR